MRRRGQTAASVADRGGRLRACPGGVFSSSLSSYRKRRGKPLICEAMADENHATHSANLLRVASRFRWLFICAARATGLVYNCLRNPRRRVHLTGSRERSASTHFFGPPLRRGLLVQALPLSRAHALRGTHIR